MVLALNLVWFFFLLALLVGVATWLLFLWAIRTGQFKRTQEVADRMLERERQEGL